MNIKPNPSFLISTPEGDVRVTVRGRDSSVFQAAHAERARLEAEAAGAATVADRLLALCPCTLMDAACELDIAHKAIRGHALGLMRSGRARMLRGKLVKVSDER